MIVPRSLIDFIVASLQRERSVNVSDRDHLTCELLNRLDISKRLTNGKCLMKVRSPHSARPYTVRGLDTVPCSEAIFFDKEAQRDQYQYVEAFVEAFVEASYV